MHKCVKRQLSVFGFLPRTALANVFRLLLERHLLSAVTIPISVTRFRRLHEPGVLAAKAIGQVDSPDRVPKLGLIGVQCHHRANSLSGQ